jgi:hypothetical protein
LFFFASTFPEIIETNAVMGNKSRLHGSLSHRGAPLGY